MPRTAAHLTQRLALHPGSFLYACDHLVIGGVLFLIVFSPLAFGSVHPWAFSLMEAVIFLLAAVWMTKLLLSSFTHSPVRPFALFPWYSRPLFLSLTLFTGLVLFQLLPLPPSLLRGLSPATYAVYTHSLPGWPEKIPYEEFASQSVPADSQPQAPDAKSAAPDARRRVFNFSSGLWRPLSIAPEL